MVNIQAHNHKPRMIRVFHNTLVATGTGIRVSGVDTAYDQQVSGNAVFSGRPFSPGSQVQQINNVSDTYDAADNYLGAPFGDPTQGSLSLFPETGTLSDSPVDSASLQLFTDWNLDFNGDQRTQGFRGAYAEEGVNSGWQPALTMKPEAGTVSNDPPGIVMQPESVTVTEGEDTRFSVVAAGRAPLVYQWYRNGNLIDGATRASYTLTGARLSDNGRVYRCEISNSLGAVSSNGAILTVLADVIAPVLASAFAPDDRRVDILFSEAITTSSAEDPANYQVNPGIAVTSATLDDDGRRVSLRVSPLIDDTAYTVVVNNVQDLAQSSNTIVAQSSTSFTYRTTDAFENGSAGGWTPPTAARWSVVMDEGDMAYYLNTSDYNNRPVGRLGEYSLLSVAYGDFIFTAQAKLGDDVNNNTLADYAVVFGFQDADNYYFVMFNNTQSATQLFKVVNGSRVELAIAEADWLDDNLYHSIKVSREGSEIKVYFDDNLIMSASDDSLGTGKVGVGSYNDSAYFDDVKVIAVAGTSPDTTPPVIKLTGADSQQIPLGSAYTDPGATATDNIEGDISTRIEMNASAVDTTRAGSYRVTYNVADNEGNQAIEVVRQVNVVADNGDAVGNDNSAGNSGGGGALGWFGILLGLLVYGRYFGYANHQIGFRGVATPQKYYW